MSPVILQRTSIGRCNQLQKHRGVNVSVMSGCRLLLFTSQFVTLQYFSAYFPDKFMALKEEKSALSAALPSSLSPASSVRTAFRRTPDSSRWLHVEGLGLGKDS